MTPQQTEWGYVEWGMYIQAQDGTVWRVDARWGDNSDDAKPYWNFRLTNREGQYVDVAKDANDPVTIMVPTTSEAVATVYKTLGLTSRTPMKLPAEPTKDTPNNRRLLAGHLFHIHHEPINLNTDARDMAFLIETHNLAHARPRPGSIPHIHTGG